MAMSKNLMTGQESGGSEIGWSGDEWLGDYWGKDWGRRAGEGGGEEGVVLGCLGDFVKTGLDLNVFWLD
jgi:hypothetical protein